MKVYLKLLLFIIILIERQLKNEARCCVIFRLIPENWPRGGSSTSPNMEEPIIWRAQSGNIFFNCYHHYTFSIIIIYHYYIFFLIPIVCIFLRNILYIQHNLFSFLLLVFLFFSFLFLYIYVTLISHLSRFILKYLGLVSQLIYSLTYILWQLFILLLYPLVLFYFSYIVVISCTYHSFLFLPQFFPCKLLFLISFHHFLLLPYSHFFSYLEIFS